MALIPAIIIGAVVLTFIQNASYPPGGPRKGDENIGFRKVITEGLHAAPLECTPISTSNETLTWVLACELYRKPKGTLVQNNPNTFQTPPFARAVLKFKPRLSLQISLVKGTDKKMLITTDEAKRLLNDDFDSSPHLLILPFMNTEKTQQGPTISIPHVPTLVGSTASFTISQLKVGKNLASTFLQYSKSR